MKITNFSYSWIELPNKYSSSNLYTSFIKISSQNDSSSVMGRADNKHPYFLCQNDNKKFNKDKLIPLTVTSTEQMTSSKLPLSSYSGTVNFAASDSEFNVKVEHDGTETFKKYVSKNEEVKKWFPAKIGDNDYSGKSSADGWWEEQRGRFSPIPHKTA